jgi:hypothetical protein
MEGSTYYYAHGMYITNGIPASVCEAIAATPDTEVLAPAPGPAAPLPWCGYVDPDGVNDDQCPPCDEHLCPMDECIARCAACASCESIRVNSDNGRCHFKKEVAFAAFEATSPGPMFETTYAGGWKSYVNARDSVCKKHSEQAAKEAAGAPAPAGEAPVTDTEAKTEVHRPQNGKCAYGYELVMGQVTNYGVCHSSLEFGRCILPPNLAVARCEEDPTCTGVSETNMTVWQSQYPGMQMLGRLPVNPDAAWKTCMKATASRTWSHIVSTAASSLLQDAGKRKELENATATPANEQAQQQQKKRSAAESVAGIGPALSW